MRINTIPLEKGSDAEKRLYLDVILEAMTDDEYADFISARIPSSVILHSVSARIATAH
jgi:hypothetical protein